MTEPKMKCADCGCEVNRNVIQGIYYCPRCDDDKSERDILVMTNRDIINAMTDEELSKWKLDLSGSEHVRGKNGFCRIWWQDAKHCSENCKCKDCLTEWLKAPTGKHQEVEG